MAPVPLKDYYRVVMREEILVKNALCQIQGIQGIGFGGEGSGIKFLRPIIVYNQPFYPFNLQVVQRFERVLVRLYQERVGSVLPNHVGSKICRPFGFG